MNFGSIPNLPPSEKRWRMMETMKSWVLWLTYESPFIELDCGLDLLEKLSQVTKMARLAVLRSPRRF